MFSEEEEQRHSRGNITSDLRNQMLTRYVNDQLQLGLSRDWMDCGGGGGGKRCSQRKRNRDIQEEI